jgi:UrcA family protein
MYANTALTSARLLVGAAVITCTLFAADVRAKDVTVAIQVRAHGLDLTKSADAKTFYRRLQNAAWVACTRGNRVDLEPVDDLRGCVEKAIGGAIRSAKTPLLTQIYLETHTLRDAAKYGIEVPTQLAAK